MIEVSAPANIAFIKYWGKEKTELDLERNFATNPSLSMTLSQARTLTTAKLHGDCDHFILNEEVLKESSADYLKIQKHKKRIFEFFQLEEKNIFIKTKNNFPQAAGIASSASAYASLSIAMAGVILGKEKFEELYTQDKSIFSNLSRRGSGSACRSLSPFYCYWDGKESQKTLNYKMKLLDSIVIFSKERKKVSSSKGHLFAQESPFFKNRIESNLPRRITEIQKALENDNFHQFGQLLEEEAYEMMKIMKENPNSIDYTNTETKSFLRHLKTLPKKRDFYFTIDAGANPHIISLKNVETELQSILKLLEIEAEIWKDHCGSGPRWNYL